MISKKKITNKRKKSFTEIETDFSAEIANSISGFSAQKQVISKKKKKKRKRKVFIEIRNWVGFFGRNRKLKRFFRSKTGDLQKKKIGTDFSAEMTNSNDSSGRITATLSQLRLPNSFKGGLFSFLEQKSASNALKTCDFAYFSGQRPPPPGYATEGVLIRRIIASHFCTAVGGRQLEKNRKNYKWELSLNVIIPFSIIACCLVVTWCSKNVFWINRNGGNGPHIATALVQRSIIYFLQSKSFLVLSQQLAN